MDIGTEATTAERQRFCSINAMTVTGAMATHTELMKIPKHASPAPRKARLPEGGNRTASAKCVITKARAMVKIAWGAEKEI